MRLAPVPLFFAANPSVAIERSGDSSRTTHGARTAVDACRYFGAPVVGALQGRSKNEILSARFSPAEEWWTMHPLTEEIDSIASGSFKTRAPPAVKGTGYVVDCLEAALWAFHRSDSFRDGCLLSANLGDDADTTAAVYGQLAGAFYGVEGIPASWRAKIWLQELIENFATRLLSAAFPQSASASRRP